MSYHQNQTTLRVGIDVYLIVVVISLLLHLLRSNTYSLNVPMRELR